MKIYDCFTYFDENMLLSFRLNCLNKYVDKFVIVECKYSHRGILKGFNFNINDYLKFKEHSDLIIQTLFKKLIATDDTFRDKIHNN